jgi:hypothetical protein
MATSYLLPCYVVITALVLFFSVAVTEGAIKEYQFDVSMHVRMCVCNKQHMHASSIND